MSQEYFSDSLIADFDKFVKSRIAYFDDEYDFTCEREDIIDAINIADCMIDCIPFHYVEGVRNDFAVDLAIACRMMLASPYSSYIFDRFNDLSDQSDYNDRLNAIRPYLGDWCANDLLAYTIDWKTWKHRAKELGFDCEARYKQ